MPQLHFAPPQQTADMLRRLAAKEGISLNAYLVPFLNDLLWLPNSLPVANLRGKPPESAFRSSECLTPFLNDIAAGKLTRGCYYVEPQQPGR